MAQTILRTSPTGVLEELNKKINESLKVRVDREYRYPAKISAKGEGSSYHLYCVVDDGYKRTDFIVLEKLLKELFDKRIWSVEILIEKDLKPIQIGGPYGSEKLEGKLIYEGPPSNPAKVPLIPALKKEFSTPPLNIRGSLSEVLDGLEKYISNKGDDPGKFYVTPDSLLIYLCHHTHDEGTQRKISSIIKNYRNQQTLF